MKMKKLWIAALCIISISAIRICIADGDGWYKSLMDAADVDKTPPADGEALIWDDTAQLWEAGDIGTVSDTAYGASWNGTTTVAPSKNAVYDKIEAAAGDITAVGDCLTGACFEGTTGTNLTFKGATSGTTVLKPTAIAGTTTITMPAETGTVCTTGSVCSGYQASGAVTSVTGTAPIVSSGGATPAISIPVATSSANGYLASTDWTTFNNKVATSRYINTTSPLSGGGDLSADRTIAIPQGNSTTDGYINATDWTTFNNKLNTTLASANIYVGNATNVTAAVAMSGDGTMSNAGALAVNDDSHAHTSTTLPATVTYLGTAIDETEMSLSDITTLNSNTTRHGFLPKLSGTATEFVNGAGNWATPAASPAGSNTHIQYNNNSALAGSASLTFTLATEDSNTVFLSHFDGTDASTTFTDEAGIAITANGNAQIDTAQSKFGGASGLFDGTGDYLTTPDSDNYNFAAGDFSVDFQVRFNSVASNQDFIGHWTDGSSHSWELFWATTNVITLRYATTPTGQTDITFAWTPSTNTWYHIEITRSGNNLYAFVDGTQVGSTGDLTGVTLNNSTGLLYVGRRSDGGREFNGWLDEPRISKGTARHTANFTAPTAAYVYATALYVNGRIGIGVAPSTALDILAADNAVAQTIKINVAQASVTTADTFIDFRSTTGSEGSIAGTAVGGVIAFNTFTGSHYTYVIDKTGLEPNTLLEIVDEDILASDWNNETVKYIEKEAVVDINGKELKDENGKTLTMNVEKTKIIKHEASPKGQLFKTRICQTKGSKAAVGVYGGTDRENRDLVLSIGTGFMFVANKGANIAVGDYLISSDVAGCAELQVDDIQRSNTVAKATESVTWAQGEVKRLIRVVYLGG